METVIEYVPVGALGLSVLFTALGVVWKFGRLSGHIDGLAVRLDGVDGKLNVLLESLLSRG